MAMQVRMVMIEYAFIALVAAVVIYELIEHVVLPLVAYVFGRKRQPLSGAEAMVGKVAEVRLWRKNMGQVFVEGELWRASCTSALAQGDRVTILAVKNLTLEVEPCDEARRSLC